MESNKAQAVRRQIEKVLEGGHDCCKAAGLPPWRAGDDRPRVETDAWALLMREAGGSLLEWWRAGVEFAALECGSPIEEQMLASLALMAQVQHVAVRFRVWTPDPHELPRGFDEALAIVPQFPVGKYKIDFSLTYSGPGYDFTNSKEPLVWKRSSMLIECDGHDFHERTKEQAKHDRGKDRDLQRAGFVIYRYTGSEIHNRCLEIPDEILTDLRKKAEPVAQPPTPPKE